MIATTLRQLDILQQSVPPSRYFDQELNLQHKLDNRLLQEESLRRSKSRKLWLTCKDLSTKFFHTSTLIKKRRNAIDFLKMPSGAWTLDRLEIGNCFTSHFKTIFSSYAPV
jgi:hypothetical protein